MRKKNYRKNRKRKYRKKGGKRMIEGNKKKER